MDRISLLSDDLLLKILSFAPMKDAVTTSLLSKRWTSLWKLVPKLEYVDTNTEKALRFINKFMQLNKSPVLETLHLTLGKNVPHVDIEKWFSIAISRGVRDLKFVQYRPIQGPVQFPRSLYTCKTFVVLHLQEAKIEDVPSDINFPSLKNLTLALVNFSSDEIFRTLLSNCPVLEELFVCRSSSNNVKTFTIAVPWLQRLVVFYIKDDSREPRDDIGFVINAPSLKYLKIFERLSQCCSLVKMPSLVEADIDLKHGDPKKILGCLASAKHLSLCLKPQMDQHPTSDLFDQLVSLVLCTTCASDWLNLILRHSPNLRFLSFRKKCCRDVQTNWEQPSFVPECLSSSVETVEWIGYKGTEAEKEVVIYLLANASFLKKMTIKSAMFTNLEEKNSWLMELESKLRSSSKCLLSLT